MTDLDRLRDRTWSAPPVGVLETVTAVGKRRQRRLASGTSIMAAAAVLLALQVLPAADNTQTLVPARTPQQTEISETQEPIRDPVGRPDAAPVGPPVALGGLSESGLLPRGGTKAPPAKADEVSAVQGQGAGAAPSRDSRSGGTGPYGPLSKTRQAGAQPGQCVEVQVPRVGRLCRLDQAELGEPTGNGRTVGFRSCQDDDEDERLLRFSTEEEVVLTIVDAQEEVVWRWRPARPYGGKPHVERLAPEECLYWSTPWRYVDDRGEPVARGSYELVVHFLERSNTREHRVAFTY